MAVAMAMATLRGARRSCLLSGAEDGEMRERDRKGESARVELWRWGGAGVALGWRWGCDVRAPDSKPRTRHGTKHRPKHETRAQTPDQNTRPESGRGTERGRRDQGLQRMGAAAQCYRGET
jgi:hypothetical protein